MERITGTLKYYSKTRKGTAQLTADWDNGKDKMFCSWEEAQPLRDAKLVYEHPVETWDDGSPRWYVVDAKPEITLEVEWKDKVAYTKVCVNGAEPTGTDAVPHVSGKGVSLDAKASYFRQCLIAAKNLWGNDNTPADVLYKTAFTLYKG